VHVDEARVAHVPCEHRLGRKMRHGPREVLVRRAVTADHATDERQQVMEVDVVQRAHDRRARRRELEDHEPRARAEHPEHFGQAAIERGDVSDPERHRGALHRGVGERQLLRIGRDRREHALGCLALPRL